MPTPDFPKFQTGNSKALRDKLKKHKSPCKVCKHKKRKEIEELYMRGCSGQNIILELGLKEITRKNIHAHVKFFKADETRLDSIKFGVEALYDRVMTKFLHLQFPNDALAAKIIELRGKLTGELIDKHQHEVTGEIDISLRLEKETKKQMDNLKKRRNGERIDRDA